MNACIFTQEASMYKLSLHIWHKTIGLYDSHGISGEIFFIPSLRIEYVDTLRFFLVKLDEPCVLNPPTRRVEIVQQANNGIPMVQVVMLHLLACVMPCLPRVTYGHVGAGRRKF